MSKRKKVPNSLSSGMAQVIASHLEAEKRLWSMVISVIFPTTSCHHNFQKNCQEKGVINIAPHCYGSWNFS